MATSPAQQRFRDFVSEVNTFTRLTEKAIKSGEDYTRYILQEWYDELLSIAVNLMRESGDNEELWLLRYVQYTDSKVDYICFKYDISDTEPEEDLTEEVFSEDGNTILGFPIIHHTDCINAGGRVRGAVYLTIEELNDKLQPIPAGVVTGIVVIRNANGDTVGFSICAKKNSS